MIANPGLYLVPRQAQAVEEEQQENGRIGDKLAQLSRCALDRQDKRKPDRERQQPHHGINLRQHAFPRPTHPGLVEGPSVTC